MRNHIINDMKKIIVRIIFMIITFLLICQIYSMAIIVSTDKEVESGSGNVTISVNSRQSLGAYTLKLTDTAGLTLVSASGGIEVSGDKKTITGASASGTTSLGSFTFAIPNVTTETKYNIGFSIVGMETPNLENIPDESNTAVLTVKPKQQTTTPDPEPNPEPEPQPQQPTTPTVTEPKFTSVNRTMYATGDINLRASWSTSSAATQVAKGTELTITGTSTERVDGYIWYRVNYNGTTKYVASNLLTNTNPKEEEEKSNNNLKALVVKGFSISPSFKAETLEYSLQVTDDTEKLDITAEAESQKATVKIEGNEVLAEGENIIKIIVTAEDGTTKTYTLKAIKQEGEAFGLQSLTIKGTNISNQFSTDLYEYEIKVKDVNVLDIEAIATEEDATIEILGNEDLQEGENIITIIVKSSNEEKTVTYQITAIKTVAVIEEPEQNTIDFKYILYGIIGTVILIALIILVVYTIKHRKVGTYEEDETDDFEYYPEDLPERENEYYPEDLPEKNSYFEDNYLEEPYEEVDDDEYEEIEEEYNDNQEENNNYFLDDSADWDDGKSNRRGKHF